MLNPASRNHTLIHYGYIIQLGLCIERQPLRYIDTLYESKFRSFRENWSIRTGNSLSLFQKKSVNESFPISSGPEESASSDTLNLDNLLEQERSFITRISTKTNIIESNVSKDQIEVDQSNLKNINRLSEDWLYLIIKLGSDWTFPIVNYIPETTLRDTLKRLCNDYFLQDLSIFFLGHSPICHIKTRDSNHNKLSKIFYYRARIIPGSEIQFSSTIRDYAWVTRCELKNYIDIIKYKRIFTSLPLCWRDLQNVSA